MRDREDATGRSLPSARRAQVLSWALVAGTLLGAFATYLFVPPGPERYEARVAWNGPTPDEGDWPHASREGETARVVDDHGRVALAVTARTAEDARDLARALLTEREPGAQELEALLEAQRLAWRDAVPLGPWPLYSRGAESASRLLARAQWGRELARRLPLASPATVVPEPAAPAELLSVWDALEDAARAHAADHVSSLLIQADALEVAWFADEVAWRGVPIAQRADAWRRWQGSCADACDAFAEAALAEEPMIQRWLAVRGAAERVLVFDPRRTDAWSAFASADPMTVPVVVRPVLSTWVPPVAAGAGAGALLALVLVVLASRPRRTSSSARAVASCGSPLPPVESPLHAVVGRSHVPVLRAVFELAAQTVAHDGRVLVVDASPRLRLHERLGRDARWGLLECLGADMPVLGLVQYGGHPGLYLLPHGNSDRPVDWSSLGRRLAEVQPHFARIVLVLDPLSPVAIGRSLLGQPAEGWYAGDEPRGEETARVASARFGIAFRPLELSAIPEATLEVLAGRASALRPSAPGPRPVPVGNVSVEPVVLACDLRVRQRLRLLAWTRRARSTNRRLEVQAAT